MARKIMDQLFPPSTENPQRLVVSLKSWTALVTRLNQLETSLRDERQKREKLYQLVRPLLKESKTRLSPQQKALFPENRGSGGEPRPLSAQVAKWQAEKSLIQKALYKNEQKLYRLLSQIKEREPDLMDLLPENSDHISPF